MNSPSLFNFIPDTYKGKKVCLFRNKDEFKHSVFADKEKWLKAGKPFLFNILFSSYLKDTYVSIVFDRDSEHLIIFFKKNDEAEIKYKEFIDDNDGIIRWGNYIFNIKIDDESIEPYFEVFESKQIYPEQLHKRPRSNDLRDKYNNGGTIIEPTLDNNNPVANNGVKTRSIARINDKQTVHQEALDAYNHYKDTQMHTTGEEVKTWVGSWGETDEKKPPEPHL